MLKPVSVKPVFIETGLGCTVKPVSEWSETGFVKAETGLACRGKPVFQKAKLVSLKGKTGSPEGIYL